MNLRHLITRKGVSKETFETLSPVFEGEVLFKNQRYEQAIEKYRQALNEFPLRSGGRFLVYNKIALAFEKLEKTDRAIEFYEKGVKEGTITPFTYQRLACLYLDSGKLKKSFDYCRKGIESFKRSKTDFFQEVYFWFIFQNIKRKIKQRMKKLTVVP
jgi:tetratricopeptide (TPR) repeat protein